MNLRGITIGRYGQIMRTVEDEGMRDLMIADIHSHMIYDVDDGSDNFEMTKSMIRMSINEGCRHIFMTPHSGALTGKNKIIKKF